MRTEADKASLDKFGKLLIEIFKDDGLFWYKKLCKGKIKWDNIQGLQNKVKALDSETQQLFAVYLGQSMISALHDFLHWIDNSEDIRIFVDGKNITELSDGIHGELFTSDGWEARFSKYPIVDDELIKYNKEQGLPYDTEEDSEEFIKLLVSGELKNYGDIDRLTAEQRKRSVERHKGEKEDS